MGANSLEKYSEGDLVEIEELRIVDFGVSLLLKNDNFKLFWLEYWFWWNISSCKELVDDVEYVYFRWSVNFFYLGLFIGKLFTNPNYSFTY